MHTRKKLTLQSTYRVVTQVSILVQRIMYACRAVLEAGSLGTCVTAAQAYLAYDGSANWFLELQTCTDGSPPAIRSAQNGMNDELQSFVNDGPAQKSGQGADLDVPLRTPTAHMIATEYEILHSNLCYRPRFPWVHL